MTDYQGAEDFITEKLLRDLPKNLTYHSYFHIMDVLNSALAIADKEKINGTDIKLLRVAVLFHDSGFLATYKDHEENGCRLVEKELPKYNFNAAQISVIQGMIMATKIPQSPKTHLECIICDADLDYLGRDDFYAIGRTLFEELKVYQNITDEKQWNIIQMKFLSMHRYHTKWGKKHREKRKQQHLNEIIKLVESY